MVAPSVTVVVRLHPMGSCSPNVLPCSFCAAVGIIACTKDWVGRGGIQESDVFGDEMRCARPQVPEARGRLAEAGNASTRHAEQRRVAGAEIGNKKSLGVDTRGSSVR
jgi:hypothetical protein